MGEPTPVQVQAWAAIADGGDVLVVAPTGSGKTLAAFLWAIDRLTSGRAVPVRTPPAAPRRPRGARILYISPLKALGVDVQRNLRAPLSGIAAQAQRTGGPEVHLRVGVRSGDTPSSERSRLLRRPPDILITTPESLYLMETSRARETLRDVDTVIVDEVHAVAATKRGAHLAVCLERLDALLARPAQRIGLSATVRPREEVARFLGGSHPVVVVAPEEPSRMDITVVVPVEDMTDLPVRPGTPAGEQAGAGSIWPHVEASILRQVLAHRSTIVFVNSRGMAEKLTARLNELWEGEGRDGGAGGGAAAPPSSPATMADGHIAGEPRLGSTEANLAGADGTSAGTGSELARAHHGSVSKEQRALTEHDLKAGLLRCVVATSSLELGIDMGLVDQVIQVSAPPSVASGLQRIGRAGHHVGGISHGLVYPRTRRELIDAAVVVEGMRSGRIEAITPPRNPLDVLAQHTVSAAAVEDLDVEEWYRLVTRSAPFRALPRPLFDGVLDMLSGRYPAEEFAELRPRLVWDRVAGVLHARPGAQRLAVTSGGTIPDRGAYRVVLPEAEGRSGARRVGELDEEMVFESRVGDVITLGAASWRIQEITTDRVVVVPAPGRPARLPFWHGEGVGRPAELGRAMGAFVREVGEGGPGGAGGGHGAGGADEDGAGGAVDRRLAADGLDERARRNLLALLDDQRAATGVLPTDRLLVLERCRDEVGDWRLILHSPHGRRVHEPWALAVAERLRATLGVDVSVLASDDGIVARVPDTVGRLPGSEAFVLDPDEVQRMVTDAVGRSALFAGRFRECAARALLLPRRDPGRRSPLWQQRQRSAQLLSVAMGHPDFPILLETARECLQDVYDLPALRDLMRRLATGEVGVRTVDTAVPSPFAADLLFGYLGAHLYDTDQPVAERRASLLSMDTALLADLLGEADLGELLDPGVVAQVGRELQRTDPERRARGVEGVADLVRGIGPLDTREVRERVVEPDRAGEWLGALAAQGRVVEVVVAGRRRWAAVEDLAVLRDAVGIEVPAGVPEVFLERVSEPVRALALRFARTRGPFTEAAFARRFGMGVAVARAALEGLRTEGQVVPGRFGGAVGEGDVDEGGSGGSVPGAGGARAGGGGTESRQWVATTVLRVLRLRSLAAARAATRPIGARSYARFLLEWQGVGRLDDRGEAREVSGEDPTDQLLAAIDQLAGVALPASMWESTVLPARVPGYRPAMLDQLLGTGEVVWCATGRLGTDDATVVLCPTDLAAEVLPPPSGPEPVTSSSQVLRGAVLDVLAGGGAFFADQLHRLLTPTPGRDPAGEDGPADDTAGPAGPRSPSYAELSDTLWELAWEGRVTTDTLAPLRARVAGGTRARPGPRATGRRGLRPRPLRPRSPGALPGGVLGATLSGRWSLVPRSGAATPAERTLALAEGLVARHGVVAAGSVASESVPGGFSALLPVLRVLEDGGRVLRGHFVEGLGGAQFAQRDAVERLRLVDEDPTAGAGTVVLAAVDPANPYGAALEWPPTGADDTGAGPSPVRRAGALVVLHDGAPVVWAGRGSRGMVTFTDDPELLERAARALVARVRESGLAPVAVEAVDGLPVRSTGLGRALREAGFSGTPRGLRLSS